MSKTRDVLTIRSVIRGAAKLIVYVFVFLTLTASVFAQDPVTITIKVEPASIKVGGKGDAELKAVIASPWKMYSVTQASGGPIPTKITLDDAYFQIGKITAPKPKTTFDQNFGIDTESYSGEAVFTIPFTVTENAQDGPQDLIVTVKYQVCNDTLCLPPKTVKLASPITVTGGKPGAVAPTGAPMVPETKVSEPSPGPANRPAEQDITNGSFWGFIWLAITFGALSLLTPCVFPMIPITVSYFTKHGSDTHYGSIRDALIYALGIILTFTGLGVALALIFGAAGLNRFASNPYINLLITGIFLAFAFSLLGAYSIGIPSGLLTKLDRITRSNESGKYIGLLLMGLTFSLTSFTCTAPLVGTILVAAANGQLFYPIAGMLAFSTVFALPFFVLAVAPRLMHRLPRSGSWMNSVKVVMGFLEIGAALKFLSNVDLVWGWNIFTREVVIAGWIGCSVLIVLYLLGVFRFAHDSESKHIGLVGALNALLFTTMSFYLLTGLFGARLGEIESFLPPAKESVTSSSGETSKNGELTWITNDYQAALERAKSENKRIFVDYTGYTCTNCRWMEANMFTKPEVRKELEKFVRVRLYTDGDGEPYQGFQRMQEQRFGTVALPLYAIVTPGDEVVATFAGLTRDQSEYIAFLRK